LGTHINDDVATMCLVSPSRGFACYFRQCHILIVFLPFFALLQTIECGESFWDAKKLAQKNSKVHPTDPTKTILQKNKHNLLTKKSFQKQKRKQTSDLHQLTNYLRACNFSNNVCCLLQSLQLGHIGHP